MVVNVEGLRAKHLPPAPLDGQNTNLDYHRQRVNLRNDLLFSNLNPLNLLDYLDCLLVDLVGALSVLLIAIVVRLYFVLKVLL